MQNPGFLKTGALKFRRSKGKSHPLEPPGLGKRLSGEDANRAYSVKRETRCGEAIQDKPSGLFVGETLRFTDRSVDPLTAEGT